MGSVIFVIAIIAVVLSALNKQKKQAAKKKDEGSNAGYTSYSSSDYRTSSSTTYSQSRSSSGSMKSRAKVSSGGSSTSSYAARKAAEHARDNMSAEELKYRPNAQEFRERAGVEASDGAILSAAKMHSFATELSNEYDSKEDIMEPVWDLMVKGPDTSIPNERDFVSEGMDMINSYVIES